MPALAKTKGVFQKDLAALMKLSFELLAKTFLDFEAKGVGREAVLNLLQLNYNGGLELSVSVKAGEVPDLTPAYVR